MKGGGFLDSVLIVSGTEKSTAFFTDFLSENSCNKIVTARNCGEARRIMIDRDFDLCIINTPLPDEFGSSLAVNIAARGAGQVIMIVKSELYDEVSAKVEENGVFTIAKPLNRQILWSALKLAAAAYNKMVKLKQENGKLLQLIDDIRFIDRAKCILIQYLNMTEAEAHRHIEKQAMDMRITRKQVAKDILKTYET